MDLRNIAIIAHVDHGKTTLIDKLLKQAGVFRDNQVIVDRVLDSNDQERERGITIMAKPTSLIWKGVRFNIVDTPGHSDFGGEVERILSMVDGVVLLVDSAEGPMPQTKFVTSKALDLGLNPIVLLNKIDKSDAEPNRVLDEVFDLFVSLGANDTQLDFPILYASGRLGWADLHIDGQRRNLDALFSTVHRHIPPPAQLAACEEPFRMLATTLSGDNYLGRVLTGRIESGKLQTGQKLRAISRDGKILETFRVSKLLAVRGLKQVPIDSGYAGDIVSIAGMSKATVADTIADLDVTSPIPSQPIDPPTITISFAINDSPLAGKDGTKLQSRVIRERLMRECDSNVAIDFSERPGEEIFDISGRGELQLGVLIETMRREGFEVSVSRPRVVLKEIDGIKCEPFEDVTIDTDDGFTGSIIEKLTKRKAEILEVKASNLNRVRIVARAPSRGLIGYHSEFMTDTKGTGLLNRVFSSWQPFKGVIPGRTRGVLVSIGKGKAVAYAIFNLEDRGKFFISSGDEVYQGMIVGEHNRSNDLDINPLRGKKLTNIRASGSDEAIRLTPPMTFTVEQAIAYIDDDELVEVTPNSIRLRKKFLDLTDRKRNQKIAS